MTAVRILVWAFGLFGHDGGTMVSPGFETPPEGLVTLTGERGRDGVRNGRPSESHLADSLQSSALLLAVIEPARAGRPVRPAAP